MFFSFLTVHNNNEKGCVTKMQKLFRLISEDARFFSVFSQY